MPSIDEYTKREFAAARAAIIADLLKNSHLAISERPKAILLGGQSGGGKTTLHQIYRAYFSNNVVVINGDEYRREHPHYKEINERYSIDVPAHTAAWSGQMTEALIDSFSKLGYNLIIEGTLRTAEVPLRTATFLRSRDYSVSLALMAVKPEISLISCQLRYEQMRAAGTTPRATDPEHHRKIISDISDNLATLEESGLFDDIRLYNRSRTCLFPVEGGHSVPCTASETLRNILFGPWTAEEELHYHALQAMLEQAASSVDSR